MSVVVTGNSNAYVGVVIQVAESYRFAGSFWIVEEIHSWGVQAYSVIPGEAGLAYVRLEWNQFYIVGPAPIFLAPTKAV